MLDQNFLDSLDHSSIYQKDKSGYDFVESPTTKALRESITKKRVELNKDISAISNSQFDQNDFTGLNNFIESRTLEKQASEAV